jgi:hypothetical protein
MPEAAAAADPERNEVDYERAILVARRGRRLRCDPLEGRRRLRLEAREQRLELGGLLAVHVDVRVEVGLRAELLRRGHMQRAGPAPDRGEALVLVGEAVEVEPRHEVMPDRCASLSRRRASRFRLPLLTRQG